jgi:hypothetical protein
MLPWSICLTCYYCNVYSYSVWCRHSHDATQERRHCPISLFSLFLVRPISLISGYILRYSSCSYGFWRVWRQRRRFVCVRWTELLEDPDRLRPGAVERCGPINWSFNEKWRVCDWEKVMFIGVTQRRIVWWTLGWTWWHLARPFIQYITSCCSHLLYSTYTTSFFKFNYSTYLMAFS